MYKICLFISYKNIQALNLLLTILFKTIYSIEQTNITFDDAILSTACHKDP